MCYCSVLQDTDKGPEEGGDMTTIMMERVAAGYGFNVSVSYHLDTHYHLSTQASHNCSLVKSVPSLYRVWSWLNSILETNS